MKDLRAFEIGIIALKFGKHTYEFELDDEFFSFFTKEIKSPPVQKGNVKASVTLEKNEQLIRAQFQLEGTVRLTCDRSLEEFDYPLQTEQTLLYKYGEEEKELTEEIVLIMRSTPSINLGLLLYEFVLLAIPMKKLHPRFLEEQENDEQDEQSAEQAKYAKFIYSSEEQDASDEENQEADPRWDVLKNLKNNPN